MSSDSLPRINRYLAACGLGSRRAAEELIRAGRVSVNGVATDRLDLRIAPGDVVQVDGRVVAPRSANGAGARYVAFYKPVDCVVSRAAQGANDRTIYELLPPELRDLNYAGRLDKNSRGLLLLSDDGDFIERVTHPSGKIIKRYRVRLSRNLRMPPAELRRRFLRGVEDEGELLRALEARPLDERGREFDIALAEGRKRQLRRMFRAVGVQVDDLLRYAIGSLSLEGLGLLPGRTANFRPEDLGDA